VTIYADQHFEFLRDGYQVMRIPELVAAFNTLFGMTKTAGQNKAYLSNHKITCGRPTGHQIGTYLSYTSEQAEFLRKNYIRLSISDLTDEFNDSFPENKKSAQQIRNFTRNHRVKSGRTGCFEKGHVSWNTGTKGLTGVNKTTFKKGNKPPNRKSLGAERICSKDGYILIDDLDKLREVLIGNIKLKR